MESKKIETDLNNDNIIDNNIFNNLEYENYIATWRMEYGRNTGNYLWDKDGGEIINILNDSFEEVILDRVSYFREKKIKMIIDGI